MNPTDLLVKLCRSLLRCVLVVAALIAGNGCVSDNRLTEGTALTYRVGLPETVARDRDGAVTPAEDVRRVLESRLSGYGLPGKVSVLDGQRVRVHLPGSTEVNADTKKLLEVPGRFAFHLVAPDAQQGERRVAEWESKYAAYLGGLRDYTADKLSEPPVEPERRVI